MKKLFVILACAMAAVSTYAQGTVNFTTPIPGSVDIKVSDPNNVLLSGTDYTAQLWGGPANSPESALQPLTPTTNFRTGAGAGYVVPAGAVVVPGVPGGQTATLQLRVFRGTDWNTSLERGSSALFQVGPLGDPTTSPPGLPVDPTAFGTATFQTVIIPEPTTIALGLLGAAALLLRRRK
jgi:hypothetical protein